MTDVDPKLADQIRDQTAWTSDQAAYGDLDRKDQAEKEK